MNRLHRIATPTVLLLTAVLLVPAIAQAGPRRAHRRGHQQDHQQVHRSTAHQRFVFQPRVVVVESTRFDVRRPVVRAHIAPARSHVIQRRYDDWMILSPRSLLEVKAALDDAPFSDDKMAIIRDVARGWLLTTRQAMELADGVTFSSDRLEALALMYPSVVDPENFYKAYELLPFSDDRAELRRRTGRR